jgi:aspartyl aminopeptidase
VGVQTYGGGQWCTWFDRDLKIAGRVLTKSKSSVTPASSTSTSSSCSLTHRLVHVDRPVLRVPTLAIHLNRTLNQDGFKFNLQTQLAPVLATEVKAQLNCITNTTTTATAEEEEKKKKSEGEKMTTTKHHALLVRMLAAELQCEAEEIEDFELCLADHQPAAIGGALNEFVFAPRLDNLLSSYCAISALLQYAEDSEVVAAEPAIQTVACFDNEEVGSLVGVAWSVNECVCVCVCVWDCVCVYVCVCVCVCVHVFLYVCMCVCVFLFVLPFNVALVNIVLPRSEFVADRSLHLSHHGESFAARR